MFNVIVQLSPVESIYAQPRPWSLASEMPEQQFILFIQANKLAAKRKAHDDAEKSKKKKARKWPVYWCFWKLDLQRIACVMFDNPEGVVSFTSVRIKHRIGNTLNVELLM